MFIKEYTPYNEKNRDKLLTADPAGFEPTHLKHLNKMQWALFHLSYRSFMWTDNEM